MRIITTLIQSSSLYNLSGNPVTLLSSLNNTSSIYNIDKIEWRYNYGTSPYNFSLPTIFQLTNGTDYFSDFVAENLNLTQNRIFNFPDQYSLSGSLALSLSGSNPTTGDGDLYIDVYYDVVDPAAPTQNFVFSGSKFSVESFLRGANNQTFNDFTSTEGELSITRGAVSHTEGYYTQTGNFLGWFSDPIASPTPGKIIISGSYSSVKTIIDNSDATHILVNYNPGSPSTQVEAYEIASVTNVGSPPSASINLVDNTISIGSQVVVGLSNTPSPSGADQYVYGGNYSHAEGYLSQTVGDYSHTEGFQTIAIGVSSHAEGIESIAIGNYSHASGIGTLATKLGQTALGQYNKANNKTDLFVIGNGTDTLNRSDIFSVSTSSVTISGSLNVSTDINANLTGTASWATNAVTATTALTASHAPSYVLTSTTSSMLATYLLTSQTSSFIRNSQTSSMSVLSSSFALTASYVLNASTVLTDTIGARIYTDDTFITAGSKGYKHIAYDSDIIKTRTIANTNGYIDVNIKRNGTTLGTLSLSNQSSSLDTVLSGWTTQLNTDDLIEFYVSQSSTYITDISIFIDIQSR